MNLNPFSRTPATLIGGMILGGALVFAGILFERHSVPSVQASEGAPPPTVPSLPGLSADVEHLKSLIPEQSLGMEGVSFNFSNLWFAAKAKNWPLAEFYLEEAGENMEWAIKINPVRKSPNDEDIEMLKIFEAVEGSILKPMAEDLKNKDTKKFEENYKLMLENGCYACHKSIGKPYLRPQIPKGPPRERIINFDPDAKWPQ